MSHDEALATLSATTQKPVFRSALVHLKPGTELALRLDDRLEFALFMSGNEVLVEERQAQADVEFSFSAEALRQLSEDPGEQLARFGIALGEQILAGQMKIRVRGSLWRVVTGGYIQMIFAAGPELMQFLALHGLTNAQKIVDLMRNLKK